MGISLWIQGFPRHKNVDKWHGIVDKCPRKTKMSYLSYLIAALFFDMDFIKFRFVKNQKKSA